MRDLIEQAVEYGQRRGIGEGIFVCVPEGQGAEVLEAIAHINMPKYFHTPALRAATFGQLGRREDARKALQDLQALRPDFAATARQEYGKWYDSELVEQLIEGLRKAGLEIPDEQN